MSLLLCIVLFYVFQRQLIYFPLKHKPGLARYHAEDMQIVYVKTDDQLSLRSWYKPAVEGRPTVLLLHGNAGHIGYRMPLVRPLLNEGFGVLLLEYRGYGGNPGKPTEQGLYVDANGAWQFLMTHGVAPQRIVLYGESLGTAVASYLAAEHGVCCMILQSPFTSLVSLAHHHYPWALIPPWDKYDTLARIDKNHAPLLIVHGEQDTLVPIEEGKTVWQRANQPKTFKAFPNKSHHDLWDPEFYEEVIEFIRKQC